MESCIWDSSLLPIFFSMRNVSLCESTTVCSFPGKGHLGYFLVGVNVDKFRPYLRGAKSASVTRFDFLLVRLSWLSECCSSCLHDKHRVVSSLTFARFWFLFSVLYPWTGNRWWAVPTKWKYSDAYSLQDSWEQAYSSNVGRFRVFQVWLQRNFPPPHLEYEATLTLTGFAASFPFGKQTMPAPSALRSVLTFLASLEIVHRTGIRVFGKPSVEIRTESKEPEANTLSF